MEKNFNDFLFKGMYEIPPEYIKIILKFMLHENILDKYMKNVGAHMSYILKNTWSRPLLPRKFQSYEMCNFFNYTLCWCSTVEGATFWRNVHNRWLSFLGREDLKPKEHLHKKIKNIC